MKRLSVVAAYMHRFGVRVAFVLALTGGLWTGRLSAQQLTIKGQYGMMAGTTPPPGIYVGL